MPNPNYWDTRLPKPKLKKLVLIGVPDDATLTAGLGRAPSQGTYPIALSTLRQLEQSSQVKVYQGPAFGTDALVVNARSGPLADARVRRALALAIDRNGIINAVFHGAATVPHALEGPGTWGSGKGVYAAAWNALPALDKNLVAAKKLIQQAARQARRSASEPPPNCRASTPRCWRCGGSEADRVERKLVSVSAANYFSFQPQGQATVDSFLTINYGDYADPTALTRRSCSRMGRRTSPLQQSPRDGASQPRSRTADPNARAKLAARHRRF